MTSSDECKKIASSIENFKSVVDFDCLIYITFADFITATGFPLWGSILACGLVSTVYTTLVRIN